MKTCPSCGSDFGTDQFPNFGFCPYDGEELEDKEEEDEAAAAS